MKTKKSHEGVMLIDHRFSPGLPEPVHIPGLPTITAPGGQVIEAAILACRHCSTELIKTGSGLSQCFYGGYCPGCDHYICERCEGLRLIHGCMTIEKVIDTILEENARNLNISEI